MSLDLTWLGHSCFLLNNGEYSILIDPFLNDSPVSPTKKEEVEADYIFITHGHFDHVSDAVAIAQRTDAMVVTNFEIGQWLQGQGIAEEKIIAMNIGGTAALPFGSAKMTFAQHSSSLPDGSYGGIAGGFILKFATERIYFSGDTALHLDMKLIGMGGLDIAVLPIGDLFTMGVDDSIEAIKFLNPSRVIPCHYNTWPPINQDAQSWADKVRSHTAAEPVVLELGEKYSL